MYYIFLSGTYQFSTYVSVAYFLQIWLNSVGPFVLTKMYVYCFSRLVFHFFSNVDVYLCVANALLSSAI